MISTSYNIYFLWLFSDAYIIYRLQELEDQYRKEREEASNLLEQQRLVSYFRLVRTLLVYRW